MKISIARVKGENRESSVDFALCVLQARVSIFMLAEQLKDDMTLFAMGCHCVGLLLPHSLKPFVLS